MSDDDAMHTKEALLAWLIAPTSTSGAIYVPICAFGERKLANACQVF